MQPYIAPHSCLHRKYQMCVSLEKLQVCTSHICLPSRHLVMLCPAFELGRDGGGDASSRDSRAGPGLVGILPVCSDAGNPRGGGGGGTGHFPGLQDAWTVQGALLSSQAVAKAPGTSSCPRLRAVAHRKAQGVAQLRRGRCRAPHGCSPPCPEDSTPLRLPWRPPAAMAMPVPGRALGPASGYAALTCTPRCRSYRVSPSLSTSVLPEPKGRLEGQACEGSRVI